MIVIRMISIILGMLFGASILSGSSIFNYTWFSAPHDISILLIKIIVPISLMLLINRILIYLFKK
jgi:hypothetical protein